MEINKVYQGNVIPVLKSFPDESIDMCITSPPYWALRNYDTKGVIWDGDENCKHDFSAIAEPRRARSTSDIKNPETVSKIQSGNQGSSHNLPNTAFCSKCGAWKGELGLEPSFDLYIKHLCDIFNEVKRVLKKEGSCYVVIGDTYQAAPVSGKQGGFSGKAAKDNPEYGRTVLVKKPKSRLPNKSLLQIPARFAIEMQERGWILRNEIVWFKRSCMPSSVKDRFTVDFEKVFFFVKNQKYYFEQQLEPLKEITKIRLQHNFNLNKGDVQSAVKTTGIKVYQERYLAGEVKGRNKRCVWDIVPKSNKSIHYATYPPELVKTPILASCPEFICKKCGIPRKMIYQHTKIPEEYRIPVEGGQGTKKKSGSLIGWTTDPRFYKEVEQNKPSGLSDCGCNAGWSAGIIIDPFMGSGTTGLVAKELNRNYVGIEINPEYLDTAEKRIAGLPIPKFKILKQDNNKQLKLL